MKKYILEERYRESSTLSTQDFLEHFHFSEEGLSQSEVEMSRILYGSNQDFLQPGDSVLYRLFKAFVNPFSVVLAVLALIEFLSSLFTGRTEVRNDATLLIIVAMILVSGVIRFVQEYRSKKITDEMIDLINCDVHVLRNGQWVSVDQEKIVVGDHVRMNPGDAVVADIRLIHSDHCTVSQSAITGESDILEKRSDTVAAATDRLSDAQNMVFLGSTITTGSCSGIVVAVGKETVYGGAVNDQSKRKNGFDKGSNSIAWVLIRFMCILVPVVFIISGLTKGNWLNSFLFALSVAVGLTPELLPMVITACLAKGTLSMGRKQTIVKSINAMQAFGSMDVLCIDKTGTLTNDTLVLEYYMDILGNEDHEVLDQALLNSQFSEGISNPLDQAVLKVKTHQPEYYASLLQEAVCLDSCPFDYDRKIATVLMKQEHSNLLICKGDVKNILSHCRYVRYKGQVEEIVGDGMKDASRIVDEMMGDGLKVLAVAIRETEKNTIEEEEDLTLTGFIAFFDAPKKKAREALEKFTDLNVQVKVLTGDNLAVACSVCQRLAVDTTEVLTGSELDQLDNNEIQIRIEKTSVFAELSPAQKARILSILQSDGHTVGFLGDGINDLPAMTTADVGISVDNAVKSVKEIADVILLKKDLGILEQGIIEGRKSFANMSKYVKITASSNLGNILSIVIASLFLPFLPMTSIQLLLLNLLYDILCLSLPWDNVDEQICERPLEWSGENLSHFMMFFGPVSSVFDVLTFLFMMLILCPALCNGSYASLDPAGQAQFISLFQTGWFLESMWTQILILHLLRTEKIPFAESRPSLHLTVATVAGILVFTFLAVGVTGQILGMTALPGLYYLFLGVVVILYLMTVTLAKKIYIRKYRTLL